MRPFEDYIAMMKGVIVDQLKQAKVPIYGRNARRSDPYGLELVQVEGVGAAGAISDQDATMMLLAAHSLMTSLKALLLFFSVHS